MASLIHGYLPSSSSSSSSSSLSAAPRRAPICGGLADAAVALPTRRQSIVLLLTSLPLTSTAITPARAKDIPLFGLRKKLKKIEEEAKEIVKEGEEAVQGRIVEAEKEIQVAESEIVAAEAGVQSGLLQAGAVAAAEVVGVLSAVSVVNGILGPEARKSS